MNIEEARTYCLSKRGATESFPFDDNTLVFKVKGKMFGLIGINKTPFSMNLKCDPERAISLRETYEDDIIPGFHMNKKHWNTVAFESGLGDELLKELIDHSYELVVSKLKKSDREALKQ